MKDKQGREWLKLDDAKAGQMVELDTGFTCRNAGPAELHSQPDGKLYFFCADGTHLLEGQADDGIHCVGIYPT